MKRGSVVVTDGWKGYTNIHELFKHWNVIHSRELVDPVTSACKFFVRKVIIVTLVSLQTYTIIALVHTMHSESGF